MLHLKLVPLVFLMYIMKIVMVNKWPYKPG